MIAEIKYYREFLDFTYLWMSENNKSVDPAYKPSAENIALWRKLKDVCPPSFFDKCPIYFFGNPTSDPGQKVLTISLQPGRPPIVEQKEDAVQLFAEFGMSGSAVEQNTFNYFPLVYRNSPPNINAGNGFWRKIARIGHAATTGQSLNGNCRDWVFANLVHVDFWSLRATNDGEYGQIQNLLPVGFRLDDRKDLLIQLVKAMKPKLILVLGLGIDLNPNHTRIDDPTVPRGHFRQVRKYDSIASGFGTVHPSMHGMTNDDLDDIGFTIFNN